MTVYALDDLHPQIDDDTWIAPDATVVGRVVMEQGSSVWFGAVIRAEHEEVRIGQGSNVQDNCVLHVDPGYGLTIGRDCTIGHNTLIGIGSVILNGARIGRNCVIGAGSLIPENKEIPDNSLVMGAPGKVVRQIDAAMAARIARGSEHYRDNMRRFRTGLKEIV
jgi:carbonic anhydrase/acetyltransferase-like protein (isoleucine patch superfamily)